MVFRSLAVAVAVVVSAAPAQAQPSRGERLVQDCLACHTLGRAEEGARGPDLKGVFGRRAGSAPAYDYSSALRARGRQGLVWNAETLDAYLADPERAVPGTTMGGIVTDSAADRRAVIEYLRALR